MPSPPNNHRFQLPNLKSLSDENLPARTDADRENVKYSFANTSPSRSKYLPGFASYDPPVGLVDSLPTSPTSPMSPALVTAGVSYIPPSSSSSVSLPAYESLDVDDIERERNPDGFCSEALHIDPRRSSHVPVLPPLPGEAFSSSSRSPATLGYTAPAEKSGFYASTGSNSNPQLPTYSPPVPVPVPQSSSKSPALQRSNTLGSLSSSGTSTPIFNRRYDVLSSINAATPGLSHSADDLRTLQVKSAFTNFFRSFNFSPSPFPHKYLLFEFSNGTSVRIPWTSYYQDTMRSLWELVARYPPLPPSSDNLQQEKMAKFSAAAAALSYSGLPRDTLGHIWDYALSFVNPERKEKEEHLERWLTGLEFVVLAWLVGLYCKCHRRRGSSLSSPSQEDVSIVNFASKMMGGRSEKEG